MYFKPRKYIKERSKDGHPPFGRKISKLTAVFLITAGVFALSVKVIVPYTKTYLNPANQRPVFSPVLGYKTGVDNRFTFGELEKYNQISNLELTREYNIPEKFYLTIPKLKIFNAPVKINDTSLKPDEMLGHYFGTSLPGESKNSFIYGHATFEEYFNPADFKTIFSTLPKLTAGDKFTVKYKDKEYKYVVTMKKTLEPEDVNPYQNYYPDTPNISTVTLMTCVPPGRKDYRLIVVGSLVN